MKISIVIGILMLALPAVLAVTPPANLWGFVTIDGKIPADGTLVEIIGDCYGTGNQIVATARTGYSNGYYDIRIPMDDIRDTDDSGCLPGITMLMKVKGINAMTFKLPSSGSSIEVPVAVTSPVEKEESDNSGGGGGGGGGMTGGEFPDFPEEVVVLEKQNPGAPPVLVPPVNLWGFVYINGVIPEDGTLVKVFGDCFGRGDELVAQTEISYSTGYYDIKIPIDSPASEEDEGCDAEQVVRFTIGDQEVEYPHAYALPVSGSSLQVDLTIGSLPPDLERPAIVEQQTGPVPQEQGPESPDMMFILALVAVTILLGAGIIYQHRHHT